MVRFNVSLIQYIMAMHLAECVQHHPPPATPHTPQEEQPFLLMQSDMILLMILPTTTKKSMHVHTSTLTNMRTLDEDLSVMSPCTQGDRTDQQREVRR